MKKVVSLLLIIAFVATSAVRADEGMWLLTMLGKKHADMKKQGLKLTAEDIYNINKASLKDAIVIFGGGCTGEIISDKGLLLTNHHCGYGSIQSHSTVEHDYLKDGFWAMNLAEELPNPNLSVTFLVRIEDVTAKIAPSLNEKMTNEERRAKIGEITKELTKAATENTLYTARVQQFFGGNEFYMLVYETYKDVRLVGAPPSSIGKFGADTDNWMWPRHTGDFSMFRVYMSPDGKPAEYSDKNVPLKPKHSLPVSLKGVEKNDFAMILGYPGNTERYMTSFEVEEIMNITNVNRIKIRGERQEIMMADMQADPKVRIQYSSKYARSSNYWKYSIGQNKGLKRLNVYEQKQAIEKEFETWVVADNTRKEKYGEALNMIKSSIEGRKELIHTEQYYSECLVRGVEILYFAKMVAEGRAMFGMKIEDYVENFYKDYNMETDKKISGAMFKLFAYNVDKKYFPSIYDEIGSKHGTCVNYSNYIFENTIFTNKEKVLEYLKTKDKTMIENDPALIAALAISEKYDKIRKDLEAFSTSFYTGHRLWVAALREMHPEKLYYPDANSTMRLTYGTVGDYSPADAVKYEFYTTLDGVMQKEDPDNWEFVVPAKLKDLYNKKDFGQYGQNGEMRVCFTTNNDITGGNSGSPVLNGKGELIGCAFDGNWEAMSGDIAFENELQKCIAVDIRYVLFIVDKFAGAGHLVQEMKLVK